VYSSEEEQIEAMKKWWRENGTAVIIGVAVGFGGLFGWQGWERYHNSQAEAASAVYSNIMESLTAGNPGNLESIETSVNDLQQDYAGTPYAALGTLAGAKAAVERNDMATAKSRLQWVIDHAEQDELVNVARLRLARLHVVAGEWDAAARLLDWAYPESFTATVDELLGDMHAARGNIAEAREAYNRALSAEVPPQNRDLIQIKRDALIEEAAESEEAEPANA
jgi:predicted negative regulator of RcsB-dependent stress response